MLTPRLRSCSECSDIPMLLKEIDCKLAKLSGSLYNNLIFILNQPVPAAVFTDLLNYKRILQYKYVNPDYAKNFSVNKIANKVNLLKYK